MATISWKWFGSGSHCGIGIDWQGGDNGTQCWHTIKVYRHDDNSTMNNGCDFTERLYYEPSGSTGGPWTVGMPSSSHSGDYVIDTFAKRTYNKTHSVQTVTLRIDLDSNFGTYYGGWIPLGEQSNLTWTFNIPAKQSYTVSYNANGGTGAPSSQTKWYGESLTLSSTKPTRTGYTFKNWNTKSDGTGTSYASGAAYTGNSAVTLYAIWQQTTWTVSYNGNGSTGGSTASQTKTYNVALTLRSNGFTRTNYVFKNWNTKSDGTGTSYAAGGSYTANATTTLYAQWYAPYTISFNANGGSGAPSSQTKVYNTNLTLSSTKPTRSGYRFVDWTTAANGTGTHYNPGGTYSANAAATLYAQWKTAVTVSSLTVTRCDSSGTADPMGAYITCSAAWSVDSSVTGSKVVFSCNDASQQVSLSGTSGTASTSSPINVSAKPYNSLSVTATVTDSENYTGSKTVTSTTAYTAPAITSVLTVRVDDQGDLEDDGTYMKATVGWRVAYLGSQTAPTSLVITAKQGSAEVETQTVSSFSGTASGNTISGTSTVLMGSGTTFDTDYDYDVEITLTDSQGSAKAATVHDTLTMAYFPFDVLAGGHGIGIGKPAKTVELLDVGYGARFDGNVQLGSSSTAIELNHYANNIEQDTAPSATVYSRPWQQIDKDGNTIGHAEYYQNTARAIAHNFASVRQKTDDTTWTWYQCAMAVAVDGTVTYSIASPANFRSAISAMSTGGGTFTGTVTHNSATINEGTIAYLDSSNLDRDGTWVSSDTVGNSYVLFRDKDNENIARVSAAEYTTDSRTALQLGVWNEKSDGTTASNWLNLYVKKDGTATYSVSSPANFRSAISAMPKTTQLYYEAAGKNGEVTLSDSSANYNHLRIYYKYGSGNNGSTTGGVGSLDVYSPNGKYAELTLYRHTGDSTWPFQLVHKNVYITTTKIQHKSGGYVNLRNSNSPSVDTTDNNIYIYRVEGWNE